MPDDLTELIGQLPTTIPSRTWAPAADLRRIGRYRRRRRLAVACLAVVLTIVGGTGLSLRFVQTTALPVQPGVASGSPTPAPATSAATSSAPATSSPPTSSGRGSVPASVMLVDADLPTGYQVTDQVARAALPPGSSGGQSYLTATTCPAYGKVEFARLTAELDVRYHSYYIGQDLSTPRIDETVVRYPTPAAMQAAKDDWRHTVAQCASPPDPAADWFAFVVEVPSLPTQYWMIAGAAGSDLLALVRTPAPMPQLGPRVVSHLVS